ncbi:MAG TPA: UDP-N-acetylmuramoyl-L-alanine--D-glutamate ligase, partial [Alphaproteobacteria bacterium]|nr:UDP-N-acetylmuramoyl-L-alanine--D-glutamate ligase [Alphaproteobacteria bacterium]
APHGAAARAAEAGIPVISEVEIALRARPSARLIVITGTNGKSTTTALLGHCLANAGI